MAAMNGANAATLRSTAEAAAERAPTGFTKAKLEIDGGPTLECYFNPTEYSISKSNDWKY
jgi:hypothetical protein